MRERKRDNDDACSGEKEAKDVNNVFVSALRGVYEREAKREGGRK